MGLRATKVAGFNPPDANDAAVPIELRFWYAVDFPDDLFDGTPAFSQLTDHGSLGGDATQGIASRRPLRVTSNGRLAALVDNTDDTMASAIGAGNYTFCHDGSGATIWGVGRRTVNDLQGHDFFDTCRASSGNVGFDVLQSSAANTWQARVSDGAAFIVNASGGSFTEDGLAHMFVLRWDNTAYDLRVDGVSVASGAPSGPGAAGAPFGTLTLCSRVNGGNRWRGDWLEGGAYAGLLDLATVRQLETYLTRWNG